MDIIEGHPIPQDITGFQFRIIGDLTIKQFAYLAIGLLLGWIFFILPIPLIIKVPLGGLSAGIGIFFAFVRIQGRSADMMLSLFFKAVLKPNEYVYNKQTGEALPVITSPQLSTVSPVNPTQLPTPEKNETHQTAPLNTDTPHLANQLAKALEEKEQLEKQLSTLKQQLQQHPSVASTPQPLPQIKTPLDTLSPDSPNLILGSIKDPRGNVLPNILIEVKDKSDNPVRAFKTNAQGKFASATPLLNGKYTIHFEDPKGEQQFAVITITADGTILPPLEIISTDERENLRKSLFGGKQ